MVDNLLGTTITGTINARAGEIAHKALDIDKLPIITIITTYALHTFTEI